MLYPMEYWVCVWVNRVYAALCSKCPPPRTWYDSYLVPGIMYLVPGIWFLVPVTRHLAPGTWPGTWYQVPCTSYQVPGTWCQVPGTWHLVPGARHLSCQIPAPGLAPGARWLVPGRYMVLGPQCTDVWGGPFLGQHPPNLSTC